MTKKKVPFQFLTLEMQSFSSVLQNFSTVEQLNLLGGGLRKHSAQGLRTMPFW